MQGIKSYIKSNPCRTRPSETQVSEGFLDTLNKLKNKFTAAVKYVVGGIRAFAAKVNKYVWVLYSQDGKKIEAVPFLTAMQLYKDGVLNHENTCVMGNAEDRKHVNLAISLDHFLDLYGKKGYDNELKYWESMIKESENAEKPVNEVKLSADIANYTPITSAEELASFIKSSILHPVETTFKKGKHEFTVKAAKPVLIWGAPGIGKTAIIKAVATEVFKNKGPWRLIAKTLSNETPDSFSLPDYLVDEAPGTVDAPGTTRFRRATDAAKDWLPVYKLSTNPDAKIAAEENAERSRACGQGVLFIDELLRATPKVLDVILPLIQERETLGSWKLGDGWAIVCASNRLEDDDASQSTIGNALKTRVQHVFYEPTPKDWIQWAEQQDYISPLVTQWLSMGSTDSDNVYAGGKYFYWDPNEDEDVVAAAGDKLDVRMCTPRTWDDACANLCLMFDTEGFGADSSIEEVIADPRGEKLIKRCLNASLPIQAVDSFMAYVKLVSKLSKGGNFQDTISSVWSDGGSKMGAISQKNMNATAAAISQLIIACHDPYTLPTEEEMENLMRFTADQKNSSFAMNMISNIKHIFFGDYKMASGVFSAKKFYDQFVKKGDTKRADAMNIAHKSFIQYWASHGTDFENCGEFPDYSKAWDIFVSAYGQELDVERYNDVTDI